MGYILYASNHGFHWYAKEHRLFALTRARELLEEYKATGGYVYVFEGSVVCSGQHDEPDPAACAAREATRRVAGGGAVESLGESG